MIEEEGGKIADKMVEKSLGDHFLVKYTYMLFKVMGLAFMCFMFVAQILVEHYPK